MFIYLVYKNVNKSYKSSLPRKKKVIELPKNISINHSLISRK